MAEWLVGGNPIRYLVRLFKIAQSRSSVATLLRRLIVIKVRVRTSEILCWIRIQIRLFPQSMIQIQSKKRTGYGIPGGWDICLGCIGLVQFSLSPIYQKIKLVSAVLYFLVFTLLSCTFQPGWRKRRLPVDLVFSTLFWLTGFFRWWTTELSAGQIVSNNPYFWGEVKRKGLAMGTTKKLRHGLFMLVINTVSRRLARTVHCQGQDLWNQC